MDGDRVAAPVAAGVRLGPLDQRQRAPDHDALGSVGACLLGACTPATRRRDDETRLPCEVENVLYRCAWFPA
jgi:hypothetical protein